MTTLDCAAGRLHILQPIDHLDPIATPEPADSPVFDAVLAAFKREGLADYLVGTESKPVPRDSRGRFVKRGRS